MTRSSDEEPLYYIFNFEDGGFSIISSHQDIEPIIGFAEQGDYYPEEKTTNEPFNFFMEMTENYISEKLNEIQSGPTGPSRPEGPTPEPWTPLPPIRPIDPDAFTRVVKSDWKTSQRWGKRMRTAWNQGENDELGDVYNAFCPKKDNKYCYAGCVPVAIAQILAFHQHPSNIDGYVFGWEKMQSKPNAKNLDDPLAKYQVGYLLRKIGAAASITYGGYPEGSEVGTSKAPVLLKNYGYTTSGYQSYYTANIQKGLSSGPVYIIGYSYSNGTGGHAWIIEEIIERYQTTTTYINGVHYGTSKYYQTLHYMNWGYGGQNHGYYFAGVFNQNLPPQTRSGESHNFQYKVQVITDIKPKK